MADALPPLPKFVSAPMGPVQVSLVVEIEPGATDVKENEQLLGSWYLAERRIRIKREMPMELLWYTLYHEQTHAILDDTGHRFSPDDVERICDAVALGRLVELREKRRA